MGKHRLCENDSPANKYLQFFEGGNCCSYVLCAENSRAGNQYISACSSSLEGVFQINTTVNLQQTIYALTCDLSF